MVRFDPPQLDHERVELGVADFRLIEDVVETLVAAELSAQVRSPLSHVLGRYVWHRA